MSGKRILLSLTTRDNDYQRAQSAVALEAAKSLGFELDIQYAESDAVLQTKQVLDGIQQKTRVYDAVVLEPVGTGMLRAAQLAASSGIGWVVLNHDAEYISDLRRTATAPIFEVSNNHYEIGKLQGQQMKALLPNGGLALYIQGPSAGSAANLRTSGMQTTKPQNIELRMMRADWTEQTAQRVLGAWLALPTSKKLPITAVFSQNDAMAVGARCAITEQLAGLERERWLGLPFTGCDGLPAGGQELVRRRELAATVVVPPLAGTALEMLAKAFRGVQVPERTLITPISCPKLEELAAHAQHAVAAKA